MSMLKLAFQNFKSSFKSYLSLIISLSFTIMILCNFMNLVDSGILNQLGESNARNVEIIIQVLSFVIGCFMLFFVWYSTNVFLTKRKREIGVYVFMGLSHHALKPRHFPLLSACLDSNIFQLEQSRNQSRRLSYTF